MIVLKELEIRSKISIETQEGIDLFTYEVEVIEPGDHPICVITEKDRHGKTTGSGRCILEGSGNWTTVAENPVQAGDPAWGRPRQDIGFSIWHGDLNIGEFVSFIDPRTNERFALQTACTKITQSAPVFEKSSL